VDENGVPIFENAYRITAAPGGDGGAWFENNGKGNPAGTSTYWLADASGSVNAIGRAGKAGARGVAVKGYSRITFQGSYTDRVIGTVIP